jgi:murein DD-endopeptidase MepM/ murein hydrolase activator NlpD
VSDRSNSPNTTRKVRLPAWNSRVICAVLLLASGCQSVLPGPVTSSEIPPAIPAAELNPTAPHTEPLEPTSVAETALEILPQDAAPPASGQNEQPAVDPLRFVFPPGVPAPVSAWRPPLYPTPWAPTPYDHFYFARPIGADQVNWPLADYRYGGVFLPEVVHTGVDIPSPKGTPVLAAGSGKVTWTGYGLYALKEDLNDPYGQAIAIRHDFGYQGETLYTVYGHLDEISVARGQYVEAGEMIGKVGDTGQTTGVHLHFEVRIGKNNFFGSRNPELWMAPPEGWGVLAARIMGTNGLLLDGLAIQVHSFDSGQYWTVKSYSKGSTNSDPYYNENLVIGDLPAGNYEVWITYLGTTFNLKLKINPGVVNYFSFKGRHGFFTDLPAEPGSDFEPDVEIPIPP